MICPACHGNGYVAGALRPGLPGAPRQVRQCRNCESRGEIEDAEGNSIEEGVNKRLPTQALSFKMEREMEFRDTVVTLRWCRRERRNAEMTKTEIKQTAQDYLLQGMENAISMETNDAGDPAVLEAMRGQARLVLKMFGYDSFPGIG